MRRFAASFITCLIVTSGAAAKYGGGSGTAADPYLIRTAEQMNAMGVNPGDWGRHFKLMADIDLSGFDGRAGRPAFNLIGPDTNPATWYYDPTAIPFTGVFDGNGHAISNLRIVGQGYLGLFCCLEVGAEVRDLGVLNASVTGNQRALGALAGYAGGARITRCYSSGVVSGTDTSVGGLVGYTRGGSVTYCWSRATVTGSSFSVGGLVGENWGTIKGCYSIGSVGGTGTWVGGLVGGNYGPINQCYSTGAVNGRQDIGGLVGIGGAGSNVVQSFWDIQSSGRATSAAGMGKTTAEMRNAATFINAGWDFVGEAVNGMEDFWRMPTGTGYPLLSWQGAGVTTAASVEDFETGDFGRLPWQHAGDAFWTITSTESYGGTYSVRAGVIGEDQTSTLSLTLACGAGEIRFHVRVSSEPIGDKLVFRIDGLYMGEWSGKQDWTEVAFPVASGTRTFEWQYVKDGASSYYEDTAWLDSIVFPAGGATASPPTSETGPIEVTAADFDRVVLGSNVPVLVNFYATWCPYCVSMMPIVEDVAREYAGRALICNIDVDYAPIICARYGVTSIPVFITFKNGQLQRKMVGTRPKQDLTAAIDILL